MNNRMPYFAVPAQSNSNYHSYFPPQYPTTAQPSNSPNWERNNGRSTWKRNRNWKQFNGAPYMSQPYTIPKKPFINRFQQNRTNGNSTNFYENNGTTSKWNKKAQTENNEQTIPGIVATKKKRKPMSKSYPSAKWDQNDAEKALSTEKDLAKTLTNQSLIIKFPDPELGKDTVKEFHPAIENVHFPQPSTPRYCFAHLKEDVKIEEVISALEKIPFGEGFLQVELKKTREDNVVSPREIDPYTLYVGNLPLNVTKAGVIQHFSGCTRIDIGHPQQMKNTRYAFVRFSKVDDAITAYKNTFNTSYDSRSMIVRFRRINGNVGIPGEIKAPAPTKPATETPSADVPTVATPETPKDKIISTNETISQKQSPKSPDLSLVKEEPTSDHEDHGMSFDVKPNIRDLNGLNGSDTFSSNTTVKSESDIKREPIIYPVRKCEDDFEEEEEEDDFDARNDNFKFNQEGMLEDDCDDFDEDDDYDVDDEDLGLQLNGNDSFLPGDDDDDIFNDK